MKLFVFITDEWGASRGGINSLNSDLVLACARVTKKDKSARIVCVIPEMRSEDEQMLRHNGVIPISLPVDADSFKKPEKVDGIADIIFGKMEKDSSLRNYFPDRCNIFCIGHDIYSGAISKKLADLCDGWNIVFHHMDYKSYYMLSVQDPEKYDDKVSTQKQILSAADMVFGVGPLLYKSAKNKTRAYAATIKVKEFIPGLADTEALDSSDDDYTPIVFGRVEDSNQVIKQTVLAIDAFANALAQDEDNPVIGRNATLNVYGYDGSNKERLKEESKRLQKYVEEIAGGLCNVIPHRFLTDREELMENLRLSSAAMMLSFHEGFGLVGYEAIAAGVPLILSKNSGLYEFLEQRGLDHLIHAVDIKGSTDPKGYCAKDLAAVTKALREIRRNETKHKANALKLRKQLLEDDAYSWDKCAKTFLDDIQNTYEVEPPLFFAPDDVTSLQEQIAQGNYGQLEFRPKPGKRVYSVTGRDALASLWVCLKNTYPDRYRTYIYSEKSEDPQNSYSDLFDSCRALFGKEKDEKGPGFGKVLDDRLHSSILILDNIPLEPKEKFSALFNQLNRSSVDFYVFTVFEQDERITLAPYRGKNVPALHDPGSTEPVSLELTESQMLLAKILAFRQEEDYRDYLISYICRGLNDACAQMGRPPVIEDPQNQVRALLDVGLIKVYSKFSYKNTNACLTVAQENDVDMELYAWGLAAMGRSYARSFYEQRDWNPLMWHAYFGCKCYAQAAFISDTVKTSIQHRYESLLKAMRSPAKNIFNFSQYHQALRCFMDLYHNPMDMWRWYDLLHCETIYSPSMDTLVQIRKLISSDMLTDNELKMQMYRLCAELEFDLNIPEALRRFIQRLETVADPDRQGAPWEQCLNSLINIAIYCGELGTADRYMDILKSTCSVTNKFSPMVIKALATELDIAHHRRGDPVNLYQTLSRIREANTYAKQTLRNARGIGWTQGLLGECQFLLEDSKGENTLRSSMDNRSKGDENTRMYRQWLLRLKQYDLKDIRTRKLLEKELRRTEAIVPVREEKKKHQVFISYSTRDMDQATRIVDQLEANGIRCWFAPRNIPMGSSYIREIPRAINICSHFLLVQSDNAQESKWVEKELSLAIGCGKHVLPMVIREHELNDDFKFLLTDVQFRTYYDDPDRVILEATGLVQEAGDT